MLLHSTVMTTQYVNPVYTGSCADPFVLKHRGEYWCYSTGFSMDGRCFTVLHSPDLVNWKEMAGAMAPLADGYTEYWAPEVTYDNGRFLMYYSAGDGVQMHIRAAIAPHPSGPFVDSGHQLTTDAFAIDAHVFEDDDGTRYLFYATDFLTHSHVGTGTVCDRMIDALTLAGEARPVTLACYDWHVFDPERAEKGGVRWHTIEGPSVLKYKGLYYQMFSAGNWQNISYGVSYAVTDEICGGEWRQVADGERVLPILRTLPGQVIGPGHNSVIRGPDNLQLFCVYHRWKEDRSVRVLAIDRLEWAGERLIVLGASSSPQPIPIPPTRTDGLLDDIAVIRGGWTVRDAETLQESEDSSAEARVEIGAPHFVLEVSLRALGVEARQGGIGLELWDSTSVVLRFIIFSSPNRVLAAWRSNHSWQEQELTLPSQFSLAVYHLVRIECNAMVFKVTLDGNVAHCTGALSSHALGASLVTRERSAAFSGFAVTVGWQDTFADPSVSLAALGWNTDAPGDWHIENGELRAMCSPDTGTSIFKGPFLTSFELIVNARLERGFAAAESYGTVLSGVDEQPAGMMMIRRWAMGWCVSGGDSAAEGLLPMPTEFDPFISQHFRIRRVEGLASIWWESVFLGSLKVPETPVQIGLRVENAVVGFDMVRLTALRDSQ